MRSLFALCLVLLLGLTPAQSTASPLSASEKREIVEAAASAYADHYVFADKGRAIAAHLRRLQAAGSFTHTSEPAAFATALTKAIRQVSSDRHLEIVPPSAASSPAAAGTESRAARLGWVERLRRRNYDFVRAERLPGNVGLLQLNSFPPPELAGETAAAAMAFLKNSDALIIDLRENGGGTGDMVRFLASYFFPAQTRLSRTFRRAGNPQVTYDSTLMAVPGERMPVIDLVVLTRTRTFSAAEAFAFALQQHKRAAIVGEVSGGGGNAGDYLDIGRGFRAFVPDVHVSSPFDDTSWEGVGVQPDVRAAAPDTLAVAHRAAVQRLLASAADEQSRESLRRALEARPK